MIQSESTRGAVLVHQLATARDREMFLALPRLIRRGDPVWVEPLRYDQSRLLDPKHPFFEQGRAAEAAFFLAREPNGRPVGRIAAIVNHQHTRHAGGADGFFGFFDALDDQAVASALLDAAADWLRARGVSTLYGPASPSHNYEYGVLIEGFDLPHRFLLAHNPPYYARLLEGWGLRKVRDLLAFTIDLGDARLREQLERDAAKVEAMARARMPDVTVRSANMARFGDEVRTAVDLINRALEGNWGYSPMSEGELKEMASTLRYLVDPELLLIAERSGEPIAVSLTLPDLNLLIRKLRVRSSLLELAELFLRFKSTRLDTARIIGLGVAQDRAAAGAGAILMHRMYLQLVKRGMRTVDASWILEDNIPMLLPLKRFGLKPDRVYRIYEAAL